MEGIVSVLISYCMIALLIIAAVMITLVLSGVIYAIGLVIYRLVSRKL